MSDSRIATTAEGPSIMLTASQSTGKENNDNGNGNATKSHRSVEGSRQSNGGTSTKPIQHDPKDQKGKDRDDGCPHLRRGPATTVFKGPSMTGGKAESVYSNQLIDVDVESSIVHPLSAYCYDCLKTRVREIEIVHFQSFKHLVMNNKSTAISVIALSICCPIALVSVHGPWVILTLFALAGAAFLL